MHTHANARLTQRGRLRLVSQHLNHHRSLAELAAEAGISLRCAYKWLARYRSGGVASLADRRSVRRTQKWTLDPQHLQRAVELRHQRLHLRHIARVLAAPFSTVARALNRLGLGRLRNLEPKPPVQRYERETPGDLIHIDVKKLARFRKVGHRITGNRQQGRSAGVGYDRVHDAIDDATRLAYVEVLADEQQATAIGTSWDDAPELRDAIKSLQQQAQQDGREQPLKSTYPCLTQDSACDLQPSIRPQRPVGDE